MKCKNKPNLSSIEARESDYSTIPRNKHKVNIKNLSVLNCKNNEQITGCKEIGVYTGMIDLACISSKECKGLLKIIIDVLIEKDIEFHKNKLYILKCKRNEIEFEIEIMKLYDLKEFYYVRIQRLVGIKQKYEEIASHILKAIANN